jgi:predicted lipoprotein with Yx(FWY)xxD motif
MIKTLASGILISTIAMSAVALTAGAATAAALEPATMADTSKGRAWVDEKGMTLYVFDKDEIGKSNCIDQCAIAWPPLAVQDGAKAVGDWSVIARADGSKQWAYDGKPLYTWMEDKKPGDVTGDGVNNFHVAQ